MNKKRSVGFLSLLLTFLMMFSFMPMANLEVEAAVEGEPGLIMPIGTKVNITAVDDVEFRWNVAGFGEKGDEVHMGYVNGLNCDFQLYEVTEDEKATGFYGIKFRAKSDLEGERFIDVEGKSKDANAILHLWDRNSYSDHHQQFSFHKAGTNPDTGLVEYYIQVRHSAKWVGYENTTSLSEHVNLAQVNKENAQRFYVTPASNEIIRKGAASNWYSVNLEKWMSYLSDEAKLSSLNLPGTHDSGSQYAFDAVIGVSTCQDLSIKDQLDIGVRFLDIRLEKGDDDSYHLCHSLVDCYYDHLLGDKLQFEDHVLDEWVYPFLDANPSETIVMCIKEDSGNSDNEEQVMGTILKRIIDENPAYWYTANEDPTLGEVRGKIVLASRLRHPVEGYTGIDFSAWESSELAKCKVNDSIFANIQDKCDGDGLHAENKWLVYEDILKKAENEEFDKNDFIINYSSANNGAVWNPIILPEGYADYCNPRILDYDYQYGVKYGWQIMDFVTDLMCRQVIISNNFSPELLALKVFPEGQKYDIYFTLPATVKSATATRYCKLDLFSDESMTKKAGTYNWEKNTSSGTIEIPSSTLLSGTTYYASVYEVERDGSVISEKGTVDFLHKVALTGTATITGSPKFGETLTASLVDTNSIGTLSYQWKRGSEIVGTNSTYVLTKEDIGNQLSVVISSNNEYYSRTSTPTAVVEKADTAVPAAPTLNSKTHNSITVNTIAGQEYKIGTGDWQESGSFTGLNSESEYAVYTRIKETETHNISDISEALNVTTESTPIPELTGTATITGSAIFGETLTASLIDGNNTGTLSYEWMRGDVCVGTNSTYVLTKEDIGTQISVEISSTKETGKCKSTPTAVVEKANTDTPAAPTLSSKTHASITVNTIAGQEYKIGTGDWQESGSFTGLNSESEYAVYTRIKETETHNISDVSEALNVTTESTPIPELTGTATITGSAIFGETLTASLIDGNNTGTLSYEWMRGDVCVGTNSTYILTKEDIGTQISVEISSTKETGKCKSTPTAVVEKADTDTPATSTPGSTTKTGDNSNRMIYLMLIFISVGGIGYSVYRRKITK